MACEGTDSICDDNLQHSKRKSDLSRSTDEGLLRRSINMFQNPCNGSNVTVNMSKLKIPYPEYVKMVVKVDGAHVIRKAALYIIP
jgi:hypothetical protein